MKLLNLMLALILVGLLTQCDEPFSPRAEYDERYAMFAIMRSDTNLQVVTLSKSYDVEGLDPYSNKIDPAIEGAYVRIWKNKDEVFVLKDSSISRTNTSRYTTDSKFYFTDELTPSERDNVEIEAVLPNGRRLKASTTVPRTVMADYSFTDRSFPLDGATQVKVGWFVEDESIVYVPLSYFVYSKVVDGVVTRHKKKVPMTYVLADGIETPVYPSPSQNNRITIDKAALDRALEEISEGDPNKSNYHVYTIITEILIFDKNLSGYYNSSKKYGDEFSVRVDEIDFSNVDGGFGVFGSYTRKFIVVKFEPKYIDEFGYILEIQP